MRLLLLLLMAGWLFEPAAMAAPMPQPVAHPCHNEVSSDVVTVQADHASFDACSGCAMMCCAPLPPLVALALPVLPQAVFRPRTASILVAFKAPPPTAPPRA